MHDKEHGPDHKVADIRRYNVVSGGVELSTHLHISGGTACKVVL